MRTMLKAYPRQLPLWAIPMLYVGVTVVCAFVLPRLEHEYLASFSHSLSVASALAALSAVASGMIALTGIVFALAFVMVQFSAVAYSPRLVAWFGRDPVLFHSLGLFSATFLFAIAAIGWTDREGDGKVPLFSVLLVQVLLILSMIVFARLVSRLNDLQIGERAPAHRSKGRDVIAENVPAAGHAGGRKAAILEHRGRAGPSAPGRADVALLGRAADRRSIRHRRPGPAGPRGGCRDRHGMRGRRRAGRGRRVAARVWRQAAAGGTPAASDRGGAGSAPSSRIPSIRCGCWWTSPSRPSRRPSTIRPRRSRPSIRSRIFCAASGGGHSMRAASRMSRAPFAWSSPRPTWEDYLTLAFDEIRQYGAGSVQVMRRLRSALLGLAESVPEVAAQGAGAALSAALGSGGGALGARFTGSRDGAAGRPAGTGLVALPHRGARRGVAQR